MKHFIDVLFPAEHEYLIAALRRDVKSERGRAHTCPEFAGHHLRNARRSVRLLEALGHREDSDEAGR